VATHADPPQAPSVLIVACGALARELGHLIDLNGLDRVSVEYLPAELHNRPDGIPAAVEARLEQAAGHYDEILVGYSDCGTGGRLDEVCRRRRVARLPGAHCYELFAGAETFAALQEAEPGTFYLTDYLATHFQRLVIELLGIDRHPELAKAYFGNYRRVVYLSQRDDPAVMTKAQAAATRLGLELEHQPTGYGDLATALINVGAP
jgi:hypothetical protein